jgi:hypothetical protein
VRLRLGFLFTILSEVSSALLLVIQDYYFQCSLSQYGLAQKFSSNTVNRPCPFSRHSNRCLNLAVRRAPNNTLAFGGVVLSADACSTPFELFYGSDLSALAWK